MPRQQRLLKLLILCYMPLGVIAGIGAYAGTLWYFFDGTKYLASSNSPSRRYRAVLVSQRDGEDCGAPDQKEIVIERRIGILRTGELALFCVDEQTSEGLSLRWTGPDELTIRCPNCEEGSFRFYNGRWGRFTYRLDH